VRRLLFFYKPSSKLYASLELDHSKARQLTAVGCQFIEFLLESDEVREKRIEPIITHYLLPISPIVFHRRKNDMMIDDRI